MLFPPKIQEQMGTKSFIRQFLERLRYLHRGVEISGWKDAGDAQRTGLMVADAKDITHTRQVYDGEMAVRARGNVEGNITRYGDKKSLYNFTTETMMHTADIRSTI